MYSSKLRILSRVLVVMIIITSLINPVSNIPFNSANTKVLASVGESVYGSVYGTSTPIGTIDPTATHVPDSYDFTTAYEIEVGKEYQGVIDDSEDVDYFKFTPSTTGLYAIESTGNIDLTGYLHDVDTQFDIGTSNKNFRIKAQLNANQTYYLKVYQLIYNKDIASIGSYGITISSLADDYGSSFSQAVQIKANTDYTVLGQAKDDIDMFKIVPLTSGMYAIESSGTSNTYATIYDVNGASIHNGYDEGINRNYYINHYLEAGKTYYIGTWSYDYDVSYTLRVYKQNDDYGNDKDSSTFVQVGDIVSGEVNYQNDYDYFRFVPAVSGPYVIESFGNTDVSGTLGGRSSNNISNSNMNFKINQVLEADKTYYLYVCHSNNSDKDYLGTGAYSFKISAGEDDHGNTFESATHIETGAEIQAVSETFYEYDYFKFVPETSGMYGFESVGNSDTYCEVYDKDKNLIRCDYNRGVGSNYYCPIWLDVGQTYYFRTTGEVNVSYKVKVNILADDHGHDTNTATELILDTLSSGEINFSCDEDYFKFKPDVTGPYVIESTGTIDVDGLIIDPYIDNNDISSTNKNFRITYTFNANQTYNIKVWQASYEEKDKDSSNIGAYGIKVSKLPDDHGNTYDKATALEIGDSLQADHESAGDVDYFKFTTTSAGMYSIESLGTADTAGYLYNSSNVLMDLDHNDGVSFNFYISRWLEANSTYYVSADGNVVGDTYQVKVSPLTDDHGHDQSSATALTLNNEIAGQINFTQDADYFKFTPTEAGSYVIESTGTTDVECELVGCTSSDISSTNKNFKITYSLVEKQTYNIRVYQKYNDKDYANLIGGYGIKVTKLPDDHGNNTDTASLIQTEKDVKVVKECNGDEDYLKFIPTVSGMYSVESTGEADTDGQLFDSNKSIVFSDYSSGVKENFYFTSWLDAGSTYYLRTCSSDIGVEFTVKVTAITDDYGNSYENATVLTLNKELQCEINYAGDYDCFKFTPTVSGAYVFESTGMNYILGEITEYGNNYSNTKNFKISCYLNAGITYFCSAKHLYTDKDYTCTGEYGVKVSLLENSVTPIQVGTDINVTQATDHNYIKFTPATSGMYSIESTGTSDTTGVLYDYKFYNIAYDYDGGIGQNFYIKEYFICGQEYYILTCSINSQPYTVKVTTLTDDHGYNNDTATTITVGNQISGSINYVGDNDYFKFIPNTSGPYAIESTGSTDVDGEITNPHYSNDDIDASNKNFMIPYTLNANETYYIRVQHHNSDKDYIPNAGDYEIKITKLIDEFSDSIDTASLVDTQKLITTGIESANDQDYVRFVPSTTGSYTILSYGGMDVYGYLYDSSKNYLVADYDSAGDHLNFKITYNLEANKTYYLAIFRNSSKVGQYSFAIFPGSDDHRNEINNPSLIKVGVDVAGVFNYTGDVDCFKFLPTDDGVYNIRSTGYMDTYCEIYDSIGNMIGSSGNISDEELNFSITQSLLANHTYNIVIKNQNTINGTGSYTLKVTKTGPIGYIDSPKTLQTCNGNIYVRGWFLDPSGVSKVEVFVDGVSKGTAVYGGSRADVLKVYPWYSDANSGFQYVLDTSKLSNGAHSVKVCGTGKNGTITTIGTVSITVLPTIGSIDSPKANATVREKVNLFGWMLDPNGVSKIEVLVDNAFVGTATYGSPRSDVKSAYPLYNNANAGFQYTLDTSKLSEGKHTITVREISKNTSNPMLIKKVDIMVSKLPVIGWLDNPAGTAAIKGKAQIWGWFLDISGVSKVNVLVDNVLVGQAVYGGTRNDVFAAYPQYNNKNSGFYYLLDTLKLSNGKHALKIVEIGVHGEQTVKQKEITVNN